ncbi:DUF4249 domain-containing protein [Dawidia soli]|uniref:DUF4249 family protein n=1 Tax=Dawidia soli TaxID=2782352 RepID=A0AAP2D7H7_9BACT|nr:DUF4249 domain-containing protein [Dawidia soli]MBT1686848.1 DUF4249 family protein [Dawidia soli]
MKQLRFILAALLFSCETTVDPRLPENGSGVVIYSFFRPGSPLTIHAFNTVPILDAETIQRNSALRIRLSENGQFMEDVTANAQGIYISTIVPAENNTYSFETIAGSTPLSSTSFIPPQVGISNAELSKTLQYTNTGEYGYPAQITLTDPEESANFYSLEVLVENCTGECAAETLTGKLNELLVEELKVNTSGNVDVEIGGPQQVQGVKYIAFNDNSFNGHSVTLKFFIIPAFVDFQKPQNIKFVLKSITQEYYNYLRTSDFQQELEERENVSEPVQIATNIRNGLGTFSGYNYSLYTVKH